MAKRTTYLAVLNGETIGQRASERTYTHVIIGRLDLSKIAEWARKAREERGAGGAQPLEALTWCGRRDLADKAIGQWKAYSDLQILPVVVKGA